MDAGKTRDLQMALWDSLIATRAAPPRPDADTAKDDGALPGAKGGLPQVLLPNGKIDVPIAPRVAVALGGYSVNLSAAAVAASHIPLPRLRALEPATSNDPKAAQKPVNAAPSAAHVYPQRLELSTDDGILSVSNVAARPPGTIERDGITVAPPLSPASPEAVRFPRGAYPMADEDPRPALQPPAAAAPSPTTITMSERLDPRAYTDPAAAPNVAPRAPAPTELTPGTSPPQAAPPEMLARTDAPPAQMSPAVLAAAAQLAAAEEAKAAARVLPRPAGELIQQLLGSPDSPAPTPEFYRLIVGAAALGALLLLVL